MKTMKQVKVYFGLLNFTFFYIHYMRKILGAYIRFQVTLHTSTHSSIIHISSEKFVPIRIQIQNIIVTMTELRTSLLPAGSLKVHCSTIFSSSSLFLWPTCQFLLLCVNLLHSCVRHDCSLFVANFKAVYCDFKFSALTSSERVTASLC